jgi:aspartate/methionine/tyrosine aminotransferase
VKVTPFYLERFYVEYEYTTGTNISASCGAETTTADIFALAGDDAKNQYLALGLGYRENKGDLSLREKITDEYKNLDPQDIQITCGGSEAIYLLMSTFLSPGDKIVTERPIYQSLFQVAADLGVDVEFLDLVEEEEFVPDPERLEALLKSKKISMVLINHPHSPTGSIVSEELLLEIIGLCEKYDALLVSDEVYWGVFYNEGDRVPHAADLGENIVTIGDMTKPYGLGGLRVGWLASKRNDILDAASGLKDYTTMCEPAPSEFLSTLVLTHKGEILKRNIDIARKNIDDFDDVIKDSGAKLSWTRPMGGYTGFVKLKIPKMTAEEFCIRLIREKDILLLPGRVFGNSDRFRVGVGTKTEEFSRGISALSDFLGEL